MPEPLTAMRLRCRPRKTATCVVATEARPSPVQAEGGLWFGREKDGGGNGGRELTRTSRGNVDGGNVDAGAGPRARPSASVTPPPPPAR